MPHKRFVILVILSLTLACAKTPPNLTPEANLAFKATQAVKALDALRDVAIAANDQHPPLLSTDVTRKVVTYHQSMVKIIQASTVGWAPLVQTGLDETLKDLSPHDRQLLAPYAALIKTVISQVTP